MLKHTNQLCNQNEEKEKQAAELVLANKELAFQNEEKEKRAAELVLANKELAFQNEEKEKRAAELVLANKELAFQNEEKEKRAAELVLANEDIIHRLQNIQALHRIDQAIVGSLDLNMTLHVVLEQAKTELLVDAATVLLLNSHTQVLEFAAGIGFRSKAIERSRLRLGEGLGGGAALEERTISVTNLLDAKRSAQFVRTPLLADEGFVTYFSTPLIVKGQVKGVLEVFHRSSFTPDQDWLDFLEVLAGQTAIAVDSAILLANLQRSNRELFDAYDFTIEGWSHALDLRDKETEGHTLRVTEITMKLASIVGVSEAELVHVRRGALLHDIGKMGVPDHILLKPDKLTDKEWITMRNHPTFAFELLSPIAYLRPALDIPYCHHEKWDGSGYPRGLKGEQIPLVARLFAVVDVWDALRSDRPYRQGWMKEKVIEHIKSLSGTHFEPKAVELFLNMMNEKVTVAQAFEVAIAAEKTAEKLFQGLEAKFVHHEDVATFWKQYALDEVKHAKFLEGLKAKLTTEQLSVLVDTHTMGLLQAVTGISVEKALLGVKNLEDAYQLVNNIENGETNAIFQFLLNNFEADGQMRDFLQMQLNKHIARLSIDLPAQYIGILSRKAIQALV